MNTRWIFLQRNLFVKLRSDHFHTKEEMEPMTTFKQKKIAQMMKNLSDVPAGEVRMNNGFLNRRLASIQENERHAIDTSIETIHLLRIIVSNINGILANGVNLGGIIEMGNYLRTKGDKVDFVNWKNGCASSVSSVWRSCRAVYLPFSSEFEQDEIPFVRRIERGAYKLTLRSLYYNSLDQQENFIRADSGWIRSHHRWHDAQKPAPQYAVSGICTHRNYQQFLQ
mgnify:CR=1 FL=1